jgi:hypothetical protein
VSTEYSGTGRSKERLMWYALLIALSRTRRFSADKWQILLTNNTLTAARLIGVYIGAHVLWGRADSQVLLAKPIYTELDKTARRVVQDATSGMNKQIGGMEPLILCRRERRSNTASRFYPDQDTHS